MNILNTVQKGYSLIELLIVVTIIGILASIAIPAYQDYVKKGRAAEATGNLADLRIKMEQCFQDTRAYDNAACASFCAPVASSAVNFTYSCTARTATTYTIAAAGVSARDMSNFAFSVDQNNNKTSTYDGVSGNCWLTGKGASC